MENNSEEEKAKVSTNQATPLGQERPEVLNRKQLALFILQKTEEKVEEKGSDKNLDRQLQKIELLSGAVIVPQQIKEIINRAAKKYEITFPLDFYRELNQKVPWARSDKELHNRPWKIGRITNEIIYDRFPKDILPTLQHLNPYVHMWAREYKHFQFLTEEGKSLLEQYITDSISMMKSTTTWYDFRIKYAMRYRLSFQLSCFENNEIEN